MTSGEFQWRVRKAHRHQGNIQSKVPVAMRQGEAHVPIPNTLPTFAWVCEGPGGRWYYAGDGMGEQAAAGTLISI